MSMQAASLEILEQVDVPAPVARAIVRVFDIEFTEARKTLATKQDLVELRHGLEAKIESSHNDLELKMERMRSGLEVGSANSKSGLEATLAKVKSDLIEQIHAAKSDLTRQMYVAIAGQMALLFGIFYFFVTHMVK
jgi:hypothetical protein